MVMVCGGYKSKSRSISVYDGPEQGVNRCDSVGSLCVVDLAVVVKAFSAGGRSKRCSHAFRGVRCGCFRCKLLVSRNRSNDDDDVPFGICLQDHLCHLTYSISERPRDKVFVITEIICHAFLVTQRRVRANRDQRFGPLQGPETWR